MFNPVLFGTEEGAKFKHWAKNNFRKTTESVTGM
jgi:hypothetical protein